ncbi:peptidoglycan-binding protein [Streptomyces sp. NBC_00104]|uniref:N-acetylmuramoyl-L-alanine amidase n=1 Tax=Streptomyces sp. NBC_00104 TaxID=2903621 RepID=UPI00324EE8D3
MSWCPFATKFELQPESDGQPAIRPTQFIAHSIAAPWTPKRTYEYWRDSTNLESHFGLGYDGSLGQFIGTQTRADATAAANRRADGTGAISLESASNRKASDPWTDAQVEMLIRLGVWVHQEHPVPLRLCRTWDDPGFGYHRMFSQWNPSGHSCPGDARVTQFRKIVFPGIVARAGGGKPSVPTHEPYPGASFFLNGSRPALGKKSPIFTAMGKRLVEEGCGQYKVGPGPELGQADVDSYEAWQRKCGFSGTAAKWPPGRTTWDTLQVPNV